MHGLSAHFVGLSRNKESIAVDPTTGGGRSVLDDLVALADVFIQNLAPGSLARLGFAPSRCGPDTPALWSRRSAVTARPVGSPGGEVRAALPPWIGEGLEPRMDPVPALGQHADAILAEVGRSDEIASLRRSGAVA